MPEIRATAADAAQELRHAVLYPERSLGECGYPGDGLQSTCHLGAVEYDLLVGVLSLFNEPPVDEGGTPGEAGGPDWRIRGVAVLPDWQDRGLGSELIATALQRVSDAGGTRAWCYARRPAVGFYQRLGFTRRREVQRPRTDRRFWLMERRV